MLKAKGMILDESEQILLYIQLFGADFSLYVPQTGDSHLCKEHVLDGKARRQVDRLAMVNDLGLDNQVRQADVVKWQAE